MYAEDGPLPRTENPKPRQPDASAWVARNAWDKFRYIPVRSGEVGHHHDCNGAGLPPPQFGGRVSSFDGQMAGADNKNTSVLLIGDSLDRNIVTSVCDYHGTSYTDYFATNENPPNCTVQPQPTSAGRSQPPATSYVTANSR